MIIDFHRSLSLSVVTFSVIAPKPCYDRADGRESRRPCPHDSRARRRRGLLDRARLGLGSRTSSGEQHDGGDRHHDERREDLLDVAVCSPGIVPQHPAQRTSSVFQHRTDRPPFRDRLPRPLRWQPPFRTPQGSAASRDRAKARGPAPAAQSPGEDAPECPNSADDGHLRSPCWLTATVEPAGPRGRMHGGRGQESQSR